MSFVSQKLWAVDIRFCVPRVYTVGWVFIVGVYSGPGVENLVFDFAAATGQLRTSHLVGVEYRLLWGCDLRFGWFWGLWGGFRGLLRSN